MTEYEQYTEERTDPKFYVCPAPGVWFDEQHGEWVDEKWNVCPTCVGTGTISAKDWDEID